MVRDYRNLRTARLAYERNEILAMTPTQVTARFYQELGKVLRRAKEALIRKDVAGKGENIGRAVSIIGELQASLDLEGGGEIASNLNNLYVYLINELTMANLKNEGSRINDAARAVDPLMEAWNELAEQEAGKNDLAAGPVDHDQPMAMHAAC